MFFGSIAVCSPQNLPDQIEVMVKAWTQHQNSPLCCERRRERHLRSIARKYAWGLSLYGTSHISPTASWTKDKTWHSRWPVWRPDQSPLHLAAIAAASRCGQIICDQLHVRDSWLSTPLQQPWAAPYTHIPGSNCTRQLDRDKDTPSLISLETYKSVKLQSHYITTVHTLISPGNTWLRLLKRDLLLQIFFLSCERLFNISKPNTVFRHLAHTLYFCLSYNWYIHT